MIVQNENLKGMEMRVRVNGKDHVVRADEDGCFNGLVDEVGNHLLTMKGFRVPRMTQEVVDAREGVRLAEVTLERAKSKLDVAKSKLVQALADERTGKGTPIQGDAIPTPEAKDSDGGTGEGPAGEKPADENPDGEDSAVEEDAIVENPRLVAELLAKHKGRWPNMQWSQHDLIEFAHARGIADASTNHVKAEIIEMIGDEPV